MASQRRLYEHLARRFYAGIYKYLLWLSRDADLAKDLTQETFVQIWQHPPENRGERALKAWVYRIARNEYLQHRRRAGIPTVALEECELLESDLALAPTVDPQLRLEQAELSRVVQAALEDLPEAFREAIVLHEFEGLSQGEIAEVLGVPVGTVKSRISRGFAGLREALASEVRGHELHQST